MRDNHSSIILESDSMIDDGAGILSDIATPGARRNKNVKKQNFPQAMSQLFAANWLPPTRPMKERNLGRKTKISQVRETKLFN